MNQLSRNLKHHATRLIHATKPSTLRETRRKRSIYQKFSEQNGFVYFGYVDHTDEDHGVIRGLTAAPKRADSHYCVGTQNGYDIAVVERHITAGDKASSSHIWTVLDISLRDSVDHPHVFIGTGHHSDRFYAHLFFKFRHLRQVPLGTFEQHDNQFISNYRMFAAPSSFIDTERLFSANLTRVIGSHFTPLAIELANGHLYIYADNQKVTLGLLQTMLQNGLWLAEALDKKTG
ncbi:hypothetical protein D3C85_160880 [compost metagenome]